MATKKKKMTGSQPVTLHVDDVYDALCSVLPMAAKKDRIALQSVHFRFNGTGSADDGGVMEVITTNGHCIAHWKQGVSGVPTRGFTMKRDAAIRLKGELKDILKKFGRSAISKRDDLTDGRKIADANPALLVTFTEGEYQHCRGTMKLDLNESCDEFPNVNTVLNSSWGAKVGRVAVAAPFLAQVAACFKVTQRGTVDAPVVIEYDKDGFIEDASGSPYLGPIRFSHGYSMSYSPGKHLVIIVMPMRS